MAKVTVAELSETGLVSKQAIYAQIKAKKLTFKSGKADPLKLAAEWQKKRDPSQDDKIGPAIERVIGAMGLVTQPNPNRGTPPPAEPDEDDPEQGGGEDYWKVRTRHEIAKANKAELDLAVLEGKLLDAEEVAAHWAALGTTVRDGIMALPSRIVNRLPEEWRRQVNVIVSEETRRALSAISHELSQHPASTKRVRRSGGTSA
jgi:hypothetical protein